MKGIFLTNSSLSISAYWLLWDELLSSARPFHHGLCALEPVKHELKNFLKVRVKITLSFKLWVPGVCLSTEKVAKALLSERWCCFCYSIWPCGLEPFGTGSQDKFGRFGDSGHRSHRMLLADRCKGLVGAQKTRMLIEMCTVKARLRRFTLGIRSPLTFALEPKCIALRVFVYISPISWDFVED